MPKDQKENKPLDKQGHKFVAEFRKYRDIYKAAEKAKVPKNKAVALFNTPAFQDELDRQDEAVRMERAKQEVQIEQLTNPMLDRELTRMILLDPTKFGNLKLDAIKTGLVVLGRIQSGNTKSLDPVDPQRQSGQPNFYQALVQVSPVQPAPILPTEPQPVNPMAPAPIQPPVAPVAPAAPVTPPPAQKPAVSPAKPSAQPPSNNKPVRVG